MSATPRTAPDDHRERQRFAALFDAHHRAVLGYALRRTDDPHDAADIVAETFLVVWRRADAVPAGDETRPWLFGVARRVLANQRRGDRRRTELSVRLGETLRSELESVQIDRVPSHGALGPALATLSTDDREILLLSAWEGLTPAEIAVALGLRGATARSRLKRARARLHAALTEMGWTDDTPSTGTTATGACAPPQRPADPRTLTLAEELTR
jgi:RNA polymerase sigma-70 factor (ECF subfamily)